MTSTLLFIHGTGVRGKVLTDTVDRLRREAVHFLPGWKIEACKWGDPFGAALNKHGASVPGYARSGDASASLQAQQRARWMLLADDPLIELRVAPNEELFGAPPGPAIWQRVLALRTHPQLKTVLAASELEPHWPLFIDTTSAPTPNGRPSSPHS